MMNLLTNALKYSPPKKPVLVKARLDGREVSISVVDEGMGITQEDQARIFGRFFRSRNVGETEGIGLGLYITKKLVEGHGGRIWVESEPGRYAAFHFTLPITGGL